MFRVKKNPDLLKYSSLEDTNSKKSYYVHTIYNYMLLSLFLNKQKFDLVGNKQINLVWHNFTPAC